VPVPETLDLGRVILHLSRTKQSRVCLSKSLIILPFIYPVMFFSQKRRKKFLALIQKCQITRAFENGGGAFLRFGANLKRNGAAFVALMIFRENFKCSHLKNAPAAGSFEQIIFIINKFFVHDCSYLRGWQ